MLLVARIVSMMVRTHSGLQPNESSRTVQLSSFLSRPEQERERVRSAVLSHPKRAARQAVTEEQLNEYDDEDARLMKTWDITVFVKTLRRVWSSQHDNKSSLDWSVVMQRLADCCDFAVPNPSALAV